MSDSAFNLALCMCVRQLAALGWMWPYISGTEQVLIIIGIPVPKLCLYVATLKNIQIKQPWPKVFNSNNQVLFSHPNGDSMGTEGSVSSRYLRNFTITYKITDTIVEVKNMGLSRWTFICVSATKRNHLFFSFQMRLLPADIVPGCRPLFLKPIFP